MNPPTPAPDTATRGKTQPALHRSAPVAAAVDAVAGRRWLLLGVAGAAAAAGLGGYLWHARDGTATPGPGQAPNPALWSMRFERPGGGELVMADLRGRALLINFWATWCPPCVRELPEIDRFAAVQGDRLQVIGLAIDSPAAVQAFLKKQPLGLAVGLAGLGGTDLARELGNPSGVLPFTVLLDARGRVVQRKVGETSRDELDAWSRDL